MQFQPIMVVGVILFLIFVTKEPGLFAIFLFAGLLVGVKHLLERG